MRTHGRVKREIHMERATGGMGVGYLVSGNMGLVRYGGDMDWC